ncbi:PREDICTED: pyrazinamidase/nicotinamidase-like [Eufriesea mexicana]|uniref:pyrazinamidase/nicotinamidase-like n=1 Tax=Eufriesea mexicana TaxID=516756 RepID=UPI00083BDC5A|nr:PREDICTED: pyrazinamidase/nicotinamidase-like [Eufriesea mexicana]
METKSQQLVTDLLDGKKRWSFEEFLTEFDLPKVHNNLNFVSFRSISAALFDPNEIERNEWRIRDIFDIFDIDKDGVLKEEEWKVFYEWLRVTIEPVDALLVVDVQNDFIDGSLALSTCEAKQDGGHVVDPINHLVKNGRFNKIIYSLDWHPENHISFYENLHLRELHSDSKVTKENAKPLDTVIFANPYLEQILWPKHCVMNTWGAELHKDLIIGPNSEQVRKGQNSDMEAYSAFSDNNFEGSMELQTILKKAAVNRIYVCGLAYDICVKSTCLDGLRLGYALAVIDDCCRGVTIENIENTKKLISEKGGLITNINDVLAMVNEGKRSLVMSHQSARKLITMLSDQEI